jgi:hypothetical protein
MMVASGIAAGLYSYCCVWGDCASSCWALLPAMCSNRQVHSTLKYDRACCLMLLLAAQWEALANAAGAVLKC